MNADQHGALEQVRDTYAVLRTFLGTGNNGIPAIVWYDTYRQLTGDLFEAVVDARRTGIPERIIFDTM